jgi:hypothetical protein
MTSDENQTSSPLEPSTKIRPSRFGRFLIWSGVGVGGVYLIFFVMGWIISGPPIDFGNLSSHVRDYTLTHTNGYSVWVWKQENAIQSQSGSLKKGFSAQWNHLLFCLFGRLHDPGGSTVTNAFIFYGGDPPAIFKTNFKGQLPAPSREGERIRLVYAPSLHYATTDWHLAPAHKLQDFGNNLNGWLNSLFLIKNEIQRLMHFKSQDPLRQELVTAFLKDWKAFDSKYGPDFQSPKMSLNEQIRGQYDWVYHYAGVFASTMAWVEGPDAFDHQFWPRGPNEFIQFSNGGSVEIVHLSYSERGLEEIQLKGKDGNNLQGSPFLSCHSDYEQYPIRCNLYPLSNDKFFLVTSGDCDTIYQCYSINRFDADGKEDITFAPPFGVHTDLRVIHDLHDIELLPNGGLKFTGTFQAPAIDARYPARTSANAQLVLDVHGTITSRKVTRVWIDNGESDEPTEDYPVDPSQPMVPLQSKQ